MRGDVEERRGCVGFWGGRREVWGSTGMGGDVGQHGIVGGSGFGGGGGRGGVGRWDPMAAPALRPQWATENPSCHQLTAPQVPHCCPIAAPQMPHSRPLSSQIALFPLTNSFFPPKPPPTFAPFSRSAEASNEAPPPPLPLFIPAVPAPTRQATPPIGARCACARRRGGGVRARAQCRASSGYACAVRGGGVYG